MGAAPYPLRPRQECALTLTSSNALSVGYTLVHSLQDNLGLGLIRKNLALLSLVALYSSIKTTGRYKSTSERDSLHLKNKVMSALIRYEKCQTILQDREFLYNIHEFKLLYWLFTRNDQGTREIRGRNRAPAVLPLVEASNIVMFMGKGLQGFGAFNSLLNLRELTGGKSAKLSKPKTGECCHEYK